VSFIADFILKSTPVHFRFEGVADLLHRAGAGPAQSSPSLATTLGAFVRPLQTPGGGLPSPSITAEKREAPPRPRRRAAKRSARPTTRRSTHRRTHRRGREAHRSRGRGEGASWEIDGDKKWERAAVCHSQAMETRASRGGQPPSRLPSEPTPSRGAEQGRGRPRRRTQLQRPSRRSPRRRHRSRGPSDGAPRAVTRSSRRRDEPGFEFPEPPWPPSCPSSPWPPAQEGRRHPRPKEARPLRRVRLGVLRGCAAPAAARPRVDPPLLLCGDKLLRVCCSASAGVAEGELRRRAPSAPPPERGTPGGGGGNEEEGGRRPGKKIMAGVFGWMGWVGCILMLTSGPYGWLLLRRRVIKEYECRRIEYG
jgi:hypothetical protein